MKKENLYTWKRYLLIIVLAFFLIMLGAALEKSWRMTPEMHFSQALRLLDEEPQKAISHLLLANKSKIPSFQMMSSYHLAKLYHKGANGVPPNIGKAVFYYEQAADLGLPQAQYELALLFDVGDKIPENRDKAIHYMMEAAKSLPDAKYALAVWIERGYLGKTNQAWAVTLYEQAANAGVENAIKSLIAIYHGGYGHFPENIRREQYWRHQLKNKTK